MTILYASHRPVNRVRRFGLGILSPPAPASRPATLEEYLEHFRSETLSPAEFDARLDQMAEEAAATDALCRGLCFA